MRVPFSPPDISSPEIDEVVEVLRSGWITTGPKTKLFETELSDYCKTKKTICLNSCTAGLELILKYLGIGKGDEVITTAYTFSATAAVVCHVGASLKLTDTAPGSYEIDYDLLAEAITEKTKAIITVDFAGIICDYDQIFSIVNDRKDIFKANNPIQEKIGRITVISDSSHAFGAIRKNKYSGEIADFTAFSFHAVKNITTGEGGAVTWNDIPGIDPEDIYQQFQLFALHGQSKDAFSKYSGNTWEYDIIEPYYKYNMTDISAALGLSQLRRYDRILKRRFEIIERYDSVCNQLGLQRLDHNGADYCSSGHLYPIRFVGRDESFRNRFIEGMATKGVGCNVHYKPLPMMTAYKNLGMDIKDFPNSFNQYKNEMTLPLYSKMSEEQVDYTIESLACLVKEMR